MNYKLLKLEKELEDWMDLRNSREFSYTEKVQEIFPVIRVLEGKILKIENKEWKEKKRKEKEISREKKRKAGRRKQAPFQSKFAKDMERACKQTIFYNL